MHTRPRLRAGALAMSLAAATLLSGVLQTKALAEENAKIKLLLSMSVNFPCS